MPNEAVQKPYVSYEFYRIEYHGTITEESGFENARLEAEAFVDAITFGRIENLEEIPKSVKFAVCSAIDVMTRFLESRKKDVTSESNDGYSVTYSSAVNDSDCKSEMMSRARRWLANTGLLYRGWSKKYDAKR